MARSADPDNIGDYLISARNLAEYTAFFDLTEADLTKRILDCPGGAASVVAELRRAGGDAVAVDPAYASAREDLERLARQEAARSSAHSVAGEDRYDWSFYGGPQGHAAARVEASRRFIDHRRAESDRYRVGALPDLPFADGQFDLALCSHLLFCYADRLSTQFHVDSLIEMCRVASEVRVFPLVDYTGAPQPALVQAVLDALSDTGHSSEVVRVDFRFLRSADAMLVVRCPPPGLPDS